jgi:hypothetical protein
MDDIQLGVETSGHEEPAEIGGRDSVFPNHIDMSQIPVPDRESRLMEEDTIPCRTDFYHSRSKSQGSPEILTPLDILVADKRNDNSSDSETYFPFENASQWKLAKSLLFPKRQSRAGVNNLAVEKNCPWIQTGTGFKSPNDFYQRLELLNYRGGQWRQSYVVPGPTAPTWRPNQVEFYHRDTFETLKYIVSNPKLQNHMKWAPERQFNSKGERVFSELWSGDWWWRMQVYYPEWIIPLTAGNH